MQPLEYFVRSVNVLMELRKTLCHPYLVRDELEHDTNLDTKTVHKNLVEASSKLTFLGKALRECFVEGYQAEEVQQPNFCQS